MKFKDFTLVSKLILITVLGLYLIISYWLFWPYKPIVFQEQFQIQNENKEVYPGDILFYSFKATKNMSRQVTITKQLLNDVIITCSPTIGNYPKGEIDKIFPVKIPLFAPPGKYKMMWSGVYKVNPIREITVTNNSNEFYVVEKLDV